MTTLLCLSSCQSEENRKHIACMKVDDFGVETIEGNSKMNSIDEEVQDSVKYDLQFVI